MASPKASHHHRPKQQQQIRGRRPLVLHSWLCFLLGLLAGLAPSDWTDAAASANKQVFRALHAINNSNRSSSQHLTLLQQQYQVQVQSQAQQPQLVVVVTTTAASERERRSAGLTRTAHALRLVSPPVVWLVVEAAPDAADTAPLLRRTGVVYRHVTYKEANFSSLSEERHHQRTLAMAHIEQHRLRGVVLFAGLADVYDLRLLQQLRRIRTFGAWPVATVWEKRVAVEGPVCNSPAVVTGWFTRDGHSAAGPHLPDVDVHGFAFSSDLLLDPARWDRFPTSEPDQSHDSINFVQRLLVHDYNKTRPINCSQIMVWRVDTALL